VDLPLSGADGSDPPAVTLSADFAGTRGEWQAHIVRTEGEIDPKTRLLYAVARVVDPYGSGGTNSDPPLPAGLFVNAEIQGRAVSGVVLLPRSALRGKNQVLVVDTDDRIRIRDVEILRAEEETAVIGSGLTEGERVCLSTLDVVVEGMKVRTMTPGGKPGAPAENDSTRGDNEESPS